MAVDNSNASRLRRLLEERNGSAAMGQPSEPRGLVPNIIRPSVAYDAPSAMVPNIIRPSVAYDAPDAMVPDITRKPAAPAWKTMEFVNGRDDQGPGPMPVTAPRRSITEQRRMIDEAARQHPIATDERTQAIRDMRAQLAREGQQTPQSFTFTDNTGEYSQEGRLTGYDHNAKVATILRKDGQYTHVHTDRLSEDSKRHLEESGFTREYGHSDAPEYGVKFAQSRLPPPPAKVDTPTPPQGYQRFTLTDGQQVDGQIVSHDPQAGAVNILTPSGRRISIEVDSLDDQSRGYYDSRVAEHKERVDFEAEKKAYEDTHGRGSFGLRHGAVVHNGNRSVLIPPRSTFGGARGTASTNQEPASAPPPPAAVAAAKQAVAPEQPEDRPAPGSDEERFAANAALRRADTANRLASGQGFGNVEQQGPLETNTRFEEIMDSRAAADAADRASMRETVDAQNAANARQTAAFNALPPEEQENRRAETAANVARHKLVMQYKRNQKELEAQGVTLESFIAASEAGASRGLLDQAGVMRNRERLQQRNAARNLITTRAQMRNGGDAAIAAAMNQLADPNATDAQRDAARAMLTAVHPNGQHFVELQESDNRRRAAKHSADAAADLRRFDKAGLEKPPAPTPMETVNPALSSIPEGTDFEGAVTHVAGQLTAGGMDADQAEAYATNSVDTAVWQDAKNRRIKANSWQMGRLRQIIHGVDPGTGKVGKAMPKPQFMELARMHGIEAAQAEEIYNGVTQAVPNSHAPVGV